MAPHDLLNRSLETGKDVTQKTQDRIEALLKEFAKNAEEQANQAQQVLTDLVERSRANTEQLVEVIERELRQISHVAMPTRSDIEHLIERVTGRSGDEPAGAAKKTVVKKTVAKKPAAKKTVAKKTVAKETVAKETVAKKAVVKKAVGKKAVVKKTVAKKAAVKKAPVAKKAAATPAPAEKPAADS